MSSATINPEASALIFWEALLLDQKRWDEWLALYLEDAVYWMPSWKSENETTSDPDNELNLIYIKNRQGLQDRVFRLASGDSFASVPLDRTTHVVGNVVVTGGSGDTMDAMASWIVHTYNSRGATTTRGGRYDYVLRKAPEGLRIAKKRITMIDDRLEGPVDIYHV